VAIVAWLVFALLGWLLAGWVSRRTEHRTRAFVHGPVVVVLLLMSLNCAHGMLVFVVDAIGYNRAVGPFWWLLVSYGWWMTQLSAILALVVVTAALPGRTAPAPDRPAHF
jgi:hypothetical protein